MRRTRHRLLPTLACLLALTLAGPARGQSDGTLDPSFWGDGVVLFDGLAGMFLPARLLVAPDGRLVAAGTWWGLDEYLYTWVAIDDGALTGLCGFAPPGGAVWPIGAYDAAFDGAGRLVLAGEVNYPGEGAVFAAMAFAYPDCALDPSFDGDGYFVYNRPGGEESLTAIAPAPGGKLVLAGGFFPSAGPSDALLLRLDAAGALDPSFSGDGIALFDTAGLGFNDWATAVATLADGRVVFAGNATMNGAGSDLDFVVARLTAGGALDSSFAGDGTRTVPFNLPTDATNPIDTATALALDRATGGVLVAGAAAVNAGSTRWAFARLTSGGALDLSFNGSGKVWTAEPAGEPRLYQPDAVALQDDGKIVAAGQGSASIASDRDVTALRLLPGGAPDPTFGPDGLRFVVLDQGGSNQDVVAGLALQSGKLALAVQIDTDGWDKLAFLRLWNGLIFADAFETDDTLEWGGP